MRPPGKSINVALQCWWSLPLSSRASLSDQRNYQQPRRLECKPYWRLCMAHFSVDLGLHRRDSKCCETQHLKYDTRMNKNRRLVNWQECLFVVHGVRELTAACCMPMCKFVSRYHLVVFLRTVMCNNDDSLLLTLMHSLLGTFSTVLSSYLMSQLQ